MYYTKLDFFVMKMWLRELTWPNKVQYSNFANKTKECNDSLLKLRRVYRTTNIHCTLQNLAETSAIWLSGKWLTNILGICSVLFNPLSNCFTISASAQTTLWQILCFEKLQCSLLCWYKNKKWLHYADVSYDIFPHLS